MQPLLRDLAEAYSSRYEHVSFDFSPVGSSAGLEALRRGNAELALVSRRLLREEEYDSRRSGTDAESRRGGMEYLYGSQAQTGQRLLAYSVIAQDGIAVVVHDSNPLRELSLYQLRNIFDGQTASWDELGGPATEITVASREDGSGTRTVFEEKVMYGRRVTPTAIVMPGSQAVRDYVATHEGAIGYLSMGYLGPGIATMAIDKVRPERKTVDDGTYPVGAGWSTYPITRPFLLVSRVEPDAEVQSFMEFCQSPVGQAIVGRAYPAEAGWSTYGHPH